MANDPTAQAREELAELRRLIAECRSDLGLSRSATPRRGPSLRRRARRRPRRA